MQRLVLVVEIGTGRIRNAESAFDKSEAEYISDRFNHSLAKENEVQVIDLPEFLKTWDKIKVGESGATSEERGKLRKALMRFELFKSQKKRKLPPCLRK